MEMVKILVGLEENMDAVLIQVKADNFADMNARFARVKVDSFVVEVFEEMWQAQRTG